jgi:hypothetical protein
MLEVIFKSERAKMLGVCRRSPGEKDNPSLHNRTNRCLMGGFFAFGMLVSLYAAAGPEGDTEGGGANAEKASAPQQIVVTFQAAPSGHDQQPTVSTSNSAKRAGFAPVTMQLAKRYGITPIKEWPLPVLGRQCVVFQKAPGQYIGPLLQRIGRDSQVSSVQVLNQFYVTLTP